MRLSGVFPHSGHGHLFLSLVVAPFLLTSIFPAASCCCCPFVSFSHWLKSFNLKQRKMVIITVGHSFMYSGVLNEKDLSFLRLSLIIYFVCTRLVPGYIPHTILSMKLSQDSWKAEYNEEIITRLSASVFLVSIASFNVSKEI